MMLEKTLKVFNTVRYMTPRQWKYRLYYTARNRLIKRKPKKLQGEIHPLPLSTYFLSNIQNKDAKRIADGICGNEIPTVSGVIKKFDGDWDLKGEEYRLISFKLNSFRWLLDLSDAFKVTGDRKYIDKGFEYIEDWHKKCGDSISGDKWNAYVIAERITNWIGFCSEYCNEDELVKITGWIYPQAQELKDSLEYQLGANHLLSEAKALVFAGTYLKSEDIYETGKQLLLAEAKEQFLVDGGHYERSVSYHVESLQQCFEAYVAMQFKEDSEVEKLVKLMKEPYRFLNRMIGVNGKIPLFNDSAYDYPFYDAADFLSTGAYIFSISPPKGRIGDYYKRWEWLGDGVREIEWNNKVKCNKTGFVHYQFNAKGKMYSFFMDCGDNGPDYNLGHTHADALSILLCSEEKDIFVDSGVFTYKLGEERNSCRSTKAHNTVEVDEKNSAEVWSAFRVAKRGHTSVLYCYENEGLCIKASHDGYAKCLKVPIIHTRKVTIKDERIEICDVLKGKKQHTAISRFHVAPTCKIVQIDPHTCIIDEHITVHTEKELKIVDCKVSGMFGIVKKAKCIEINFQGKNHLQLYFQ